MVEVTTEIEGEITWCMMFADEIALEIGNLWEIYIRLDE